MKAFNKNDAVTYVCNWDNKGTFMFQHAVVYSCGAKQMILTDAINGEEMGHNFAPAIGDTEGAFPRMTDDEAIAHCLKAAKKYLPKEAARYKRMIELNAGEVHYCAAMENSLAKLHEPQAHHHQLSD